MEEEPTDLLASAALNLDWQEKNKSVVLLLLLFDLYLIKLVDLLKTIYSRLSEHIYTYVTMLLVYLYTSNMDYVEQKQLCLFYILAALNA